MHNRRQFLALTVAGAAAYGLGSKLALAQAAIPAGYPANYGDIIEASKKEQGLLMYSGVADNQIAPLLTSFKSVYPWINVQHLEGDNYGVIERYFNEVATNSTTADLIFVAAPDAWLNMIAKNQVLDYVSPEAGNYPDYKNTPHPGLYPAGGDPIIMIWNNLLVPEEARPTSFEDLVSKVQAHPDVFKGKLAGYGAHLTGFGYSVHYTLAKHHGDKIWDWYKVLGPQSRYERSMGTMIEKTLSGEYVCCYVAANQSARVAVKDPGVAAILGLSYIHDGDPLSIRGLAQTVGGRSPNSGKLMLDYILSKPGQIAYATEGKLPALASVTREDIGGGDTRASFTADVGEQNIWPIDYDPGLITDYDAFVAKFKAANGITS